MTNKINLAVLFGGRSGEYDVSLMSVKSVLSVLNHDKYNITQIGISREGKWLTGPNALDAFESGRFTSLHPVVFLPEPGTNSLYTLNNGQLSKVTDLDVVFPVMHGTYCEDGTLQGFLEMADIAYVGAGVVGSATGMDKGVFKSIMQANGIPTLPFLILNRDEIADDIVRAIKRSEAISTYPLYTKPANLGSSVGINKCNDREELNKGLIEAAKFDRRVIVECGIETREIEVSVLGNEYPIASIPGEIIPQDKFYTYEDKYINGKAELSIPAVLPQERVRVIQELAIKAYKAIDCAGMARVDFFIEKETDQLYLSELNTLPGFTSISMYPKLWEATGLSFGNLVEKLIELAFQRKVQRDQTERAFES
ncbi:MAG: D-alanine--D-alanine ligase [Anaerolineaceae bacterium]|nr:D-alanine--D-alanine ligase [Anaerolineaceae bacterium]